MSNVVVTNHLTLDGVMQAPGRPDEDLRGDFEHGGWAPPYGDSVMGSVMGERMAQGGPLLLGRRTFEDFAGFWPNQKDNPFTAVLNNVQKYVASTTLEEPLPWSNSTLLQGDAAGRVDWTVSIDSSVMRIHQHAATLARCSSQPGEHTGAAPNDKKQIDLPAEPGDHGIGRSRGGLSTKAHLVVDGYGRPLVIVLTAGHASDSPMLPILLAAILTWPRS